MTTVHIALFDGVDELDAIGPLEVLAVASRVGADLAPSLVRLGGPGPVRAQHATTVVVERGWAPAEADVLLVPGGGFRSRGAGVTAERDRGDLPRALAAAARPGLVMASVCTGAMLLGAAGLVRGRPCATHPGARDELARLGGVVRTDRVVDDGDLVTCGGVSAGLDLALQLVGRFAGAEIVERVARVLDLPASAPQRA